MKRTSEIKLVNETGKALGSELVKEIYGITRKHPTLGITEVVVYKAQYNRCAYCEVWCEDGCLDGSHKITV